MAPKSDSIMALLMSFSKRDKQMRFWEQVWTPMEGYPFLSENGVVWTGRKNSSVFASKNGSKWKRISVNGAITLCAIMFDSIHSHNTVVIVLRITSSTEQSKRNCTFWKGSGIQKAYYCLKFLLELVFCSFILFHFVFLSC